MTEGEDPRQYRDERQRLYETRGGRGRRIGDNTERKGRGYTKPGGHRAGTIGDKMEREGRCYTKQGIAEG